MRIISPVDHATEAAVLLAAGADELYGGYLPRPGSSASVCLLRSINAPIAGAQIDRHAGLCSVANASKAAGGEFRHICPTQR